ncbi:MAG: DNA-binding protein [Alphaproteobacteria bacterium]|nr:MAG: DNA-binding protein [Alphaproteobacteria bacterium]
MRAAEACQYLAHAHGIEVKKGTLNNLRCRGGGPKYRKGGRAVYYDLTELDAWAASKLSEPLTSTSCGV